MPPVRMLFAALLAALFIGSASAKADTVRDCDDRIGVGTIAEPWEEMTRAYGNNAIRVAVMDYVEPAASSLFLMVLYWPSNTDEIPARICKFITQGPGFPDGWAGIRIEQMTSSYDPARGLVLSVPVLPYDAVNHTGADEANAYWLTFSINRATGALTLLP